MDRVSLLGLLEFWVQILGNMGLIYSSGSMDNHMDYNDEFASSILSYFIPICHEGSLQSTGLALL